MKSSKLEKWAVNKLYLMGFNRFGRINKKKRKIVFNFAGSNIFLMFRDSKRQLCLYILIKIYNYRLYEKKLCLWMPMPKKIDHTWGEVQDIIRSYNSRPIPIRTYRHEDVESKE